MKTIVILLLTLMVCFGVEAQLPVSVRSTNGTAISLTNMGNISPSNSTAVVPIQVYTNTAANNGNGFNAIQIGTALNPAMLKMTINPSHGGLGDGSEGDLFINRFAVVDNAGGGSFVWQWGGRGLLGTMAEMFNARDASVGTPLSYGNGLQRYQSSYWNGSSAVITGMDWMQSAIDLNGNGTQTLFASHVNSGDANDDPVASGVAHTFDAMSGKGIKGYGASFLDRTSTTLAVSNYNIDLGMAWQDVYLVSNTTVTITNLGMLTNTAPGTLNQNIAEVVFYPGTAAFGLTIAPPAGVNMIWENESGGIAGAPTNVPASTILHLRLAMGITGGVTNCISHSYLGAYSPVLDVDALKFFTAEANAGTPVSSAETNLINTFVVGCKATTIWTNRDAIYPFAGITTNSFKWNLKNTNAFQLAFSGVVTANSSGATGDGSTGFANTQFTPSANGVAYLLNSAGVSCYLKSGGISNFFGAQGGGFLVQLGSNSVSSTIGRINVNNDFTDGTLTGFQGFHCLTTTGTTGYLYGPGNSVSGANTPAGLPTSSVFLLARNGNGSPDRFSTCTMNYCSIGGFSSPTEEAQEAALVLALETGLGRN